MRRAQVDNVHSWKDVTQFARAGKADLTTRSLDRPFFSDETKFSLKKEICRGPPPTPCFCSPGAYLVVKGVVTGYVREYQTIAA